MSGPGRGIAREAGVWEVLRAEGAAVLALHDSREEALQRFRLMHDNASLRAGYLEKRLRFQEDLLPLIEARMDAAAGRTAPRARAVIATAFACLDAASMTWVDNDGKGDSWTCTTSAWPQRAAEPQPLAGPETVAVPARPRRRPSGRRRQEPVRMTSRWVARVMAT